MELRQIEFFLQLYKDRNVTVASQNLYISQQGMSKSIANLEKEIGFPPVAPEFHQRTHRVRLKNLGTTDKKSSHEIKHKKIPRVHLLYVLVFTELKIMITFLRKL